MISAKEDAANNYARGHYTVGKEIIDQETALHFYLLSVVINVGDYALSRMRADDIALRLLVGTNS